MSTLRFLPLCSWGCGAAGDLVVFELPLHLAVFGGNRYPPNQPLRARNGRNILDRMDPPDDPIAIHSTDISLTIDERASGADRYAPNLTPASSWSRSLRSTMMM